MRINSLRLQQAGDTIVEVLIAIAVISFVVGAGYSITNRSVQANQSSQEHGEATQVTEKQIEMIRTWVTKSGNNPDLFAQKNFCLYPDGDNLGLKTINVAVPSASDADYPDECKDNGRYMIAVVHEINSELFNVHVDWDGATGSRDSVSMVYKVYK